ncbi:MAG: hypothetical protein QM644_08020 [Mobilitalea sp.]
MKKLFKIFITIILSIISIAAIHLSDLFLYRFSNLTAYEAMKVGSKLIPTSSLIVLILVCICFYALWIREPK